MLKPENVIPGLEAGITELKKNRVLPYKNEKYAMLLHTKTWRKFLPILEECLDYSVQERDDTIELLESKNYGTYQGTYKDLMLFVKVF